MRTIVTAAAAAAITAATLTVAPAIGAGTAPEHVRGISGSQSDGFTVRWSDGSVTQTPTRSRAMSECGSSEYRPERIACRATVRVSFRWQGIVKRSLAAQDAREGSIKPCRYEDGSGQRGPCLWDASVRGNGEGQSFIAVGPSGDRDYYYVKVR